mmetsp:Transcript_2070/g.4579  ORF Transcript_2070/g.4579 Transcript_2070/m.4579 type:complete len:148 (-) Transcript_2070:66-509(-)
MAATRNDAQVGTRFSDRWDSRDQEEGQKKADHRQTPATQNTRTHTHPQKQLRALFFRYHFHRSTTCCCCCIFTHDQTNQPLDHSSRSAVASVAADDCSSSSAADPLAADDDGADDVSISCETALISSRASRIMSSMVGGVNPALRCS